MTGAELQAQDAQIIAGLPRRVREALDRQAEARRCARFGGKTLGERMSDICHRDAQHLTEARRAAEALFKQPEPA